MSESVTIARHYCGPPESGNGGYTCGVTARELTEQPAEVTLQRPPPLDRALRVDHRDGRVALLDGEDVVSEARRVDMTFDGRAPLSFDEATRAAERFDVEAYTSNHPFPTCYTCGPRRRENDGLRIFPALTDRGPEMVVWPWIPHTSTASDDGLVDSPIVWAALDCPSGLAWLHDSHLPGPCVLGRMTAVVHRRPVPNEPLVVAGWRIATDGRKLLSGSALWSVDGEILADNAATWILLTEDQHATFKAST